MFNDDWWGGVCAATVLWGAIATLIFLVNVGRVQLYNYEPMQQTCVAQSHEILRCYPKEPE